jgi:hypothetical protein
MPLDQTPQTPLPDHQRDHNAATPEDDTRPSTAELSTATDHHHGQDHSQDRLDDAPARVAEDDKSSLRLFQPEAAERFRVEWQQIQTRFVDDPKDAVQGADHLLAEVLQSLTGTVAERKHELEGQWHGESETLTEDLRLALRRYRSFVNQLLDA